MGSKSSILILLAAFLAMGCDGNSTVVDADVITEVTEPIIDAIEEGTDVTVPDADVPVETPADPVDDDGGIPPEYYDFLIHTADGPFEARVGELYDSEILTTVPGWASEGYVVTAMANHRTAGQMVLAFKETGSTRTFEVHTGELYDSEILSTVPGWASSGYVVTAMANHRTAGQMVLAYKIVGSSSTYAVHTGELYDSEILTTIPGWASDSYVATAMANHRTAGQMVIGSRYSGP